MSGSLFILLFSAAVGFSPESEPAPMKSATIPVSVVLNGQPHEAAVMLYEYDYYDKGQIVSRQETDGGHCEFATLAAGTYLVLARTQTLIGGMKLTIEDGQDVSVELRLKSALQSDVAIRDPAGKPLPGAELRAITLQDENGSTWLTPGHAGRVGLDFPTSDTEGVVRLPPLPEGARLDLAIAHPGYPQVALAGLTARDGLLETLTFEPGEALDLSFETADVAQLPETVWLLLLPAGHTDGTEMRNVPLGLRGKSQAKVFVKPGRYRVLRVQVDDAASLISPFSVRDFEVTADTSWKKTFRVHRKVAVRGRVVDADGKPVAGADVQGQIATSEVDSQWSHAGWAQTDEQGEFTVDVAAGAARISVRKRGCATGHEDFDAAPDRRVPDLTLRTLPAVTGTVRNEGGDAVGGVIVQFSGQLRYFPPIVRQVQENDVPMIMLFW